MHKNVDWDAVEARQKELKQARRSRDGGAIRRNYNPRRFALVPLEWIERLSTVPRSPACLVALRLLYLDFKKDGAPLLLAPEIRQTWNMEERTIERALVKLETLGLISVGRQPPKSPIITVHRHFECRHF
jgi:hypothetical protein